MADKPWKVWEREGAKDLGGTRTGPLGKELPDSMDIPGLAPEFKYQKRLSLKTEDLNQARENAAKVGKSWVLGLKEANSGRRVAVLDWKLFAGLWRIAYKEQPEWLDDSK